MDEPGDREMIFPDDLTGTPHRPGNAGTQEGDSFDLVFMHNHVWCQIEKKVYFFIHLKSKEIF